MPHRTYHADPVVSRVLSWWRIGESNPAVISGAGRATTACSPIPHKLGPGSATRTRDLCLIRTALNHLSYPRDVPEAGPKPRPLRAVAGAGQPHATHPRQPGAPRRTRAGLTGLQGRRIAIYAYGAETGAPRRTRAVLSASPRPRIAVYAFRAWSQRPYSKGQPQLYESCALPLELRRLGASDRIRTGVRCMASSNPAAERHPLGARCGSPTHLAGLEDQCLKRSANPAQMVAGRGFEPRSPGL